MCCFSYINMVMFGNVYCSPHAYCVLHDIIQHIYKVFHWLKQCMASYDWLKPVKIGPLQRLVQTGPRLVQGPLGLVLVLVLA